MNSIFQCLKHIKFSQIMLSEKNNLQGEITNQFIQLLIKLNNNSEQNLFMLPKDRIKNYNDNFFIIHQKDLTSINFNKEKQNFDPRHLKYLIENKIQKYKGSYMHDSAEFLVNFFLLLSKESPKTEAIISKLFSIETKIITIYNELEKKSSLICCGKEPLNENSKTVDDETLYYLDLPIIDTNYKKLNSISLCIEEFLKPINFSGNIKGIEKTEIYSISDLLVINLKRVYQGRHINHFVEYPQILDLSKYIANNNNSEKYKYILKGLIIHEGNEMYGHKIAICYDEKYRNWYYFDDLSVYPCNNPLFQKNAFLFFYQKN